MDAQPIPVERRIRAAMALADIDFPELAQRVSQKGMGARTLRGMANPNDKQVALPHHLRYIAQACGLSPAFFSVDFASLGGEAEIRELRGRLEAVERQLEAANLEKLATELEALLQAAAERP